MRGNKLDFVQGLNDLMRRHGVSLESIPNFDGEENYPLTDYVFKGLDWSLEMEDLYDIAGPHDAPYVNETEAPEGYFATTPKEGLGCSGCSFRRIISCTDKKCEPSSRSDRCNVIFVKKEK